MGSRGRCILTVVALLASACSTSDPAPGTEALPGSSTTLTSPTSPATALRPTEQTAATTTSEPAEAVPAAFPHAQLDREELLAIWATDRAAAVQRITEAGWGVDDQRRLHGPNGLEIDLADCPPEWTETGPEGAALSLLWWHSYHHAPGPQGAEAYLTWLGDEANVAGRPIALEPGGYEAHDPWSTLTEDQAVEHARANQEQVRELGQRSFAVLRYQEWANNRSFPAFFDEQCVPLLGVRSTYLRELGTHPWVAPSMNLKLTVEAGAWADHHAAAHADDPAALIVMDNEWGERLLAPFEARARALGVELEVYRHDPMAPQLTQVTDEVAVSDAAVVYLATAGNPCLLGLQELRAAGFDGPIVLPSFCTFPPAYLKPAGLDLRGVFTFAAATTTHHGPLADAPLGRAAKELTPTSERRWSHVDDDWMLLWHAIEVLKVAAELPGGLTRPNTALAMWSFEGRWPFAPGTVATTWPDDVALVDTERLSYDALGEHWLLPAATDGDARPSWELERASLLARWEDERARTIDRIIAAGWNLDAGVLRGPGAWELDVRACPAEPDLADLDHVPLALWDLDEPRSGATRAFAEFLDWMGDDADVGGRPVQLTTTSSLAGEAGTVRTGIEDYRRRTQAYIAAATDGALALIGLGAALGTSSTPTFEEWRGELIDEACLPALGRLPAIDAATSDWVAPALQLDPLLEGALWREVVRPWDRGVDRIGVLVMDNLLGNTLLQALEHNWDTDVPVLRVVRHDPATSDLRPQIDALLGTEIEQVVVASAGDPCETAVRAIRERSAVPIMVSSWCGDPWEADLDVPGIQMLVTTHPPNNDWVAASGLASESDDAEGWVEAWHALQVLQVAAELPGGLTRPNIVLAAREHRGTHPFAEAPVGFDRDGRGPRHAARVHDWDPETQAWTPTDEVVWQY